MNRSFLSPLVASSLLLCCGTHDADAEFPAIFNTEKTPGGPMPAAEVARTMELPPGFSCKVFAAEPDVQQPIAMAWDARGRLWVAECYTYAENPARWDTSLRDRIVIFEDTDNDGHFDKRTVFWDEGVRLTSIELGNGGVYALCAPNLIFIPDKNGDDKPDGAPEVLLDGFNFKTVGHNIVNGLRWGPDGWLYGRHGISDTSAIGAPGTAGKDRTRMNCGIFRYHPGTRKFEVVLNGGTNSWGHDWDANGELFWINTVIGHLFHGIPGAYYERMFGTHLNPHVYETIAQTADHYHFDQGKEKWADIKKGVSSKTDELGGGHAHVGCMIYNGGSWPKEYAGRLLTCNLHGNRINTDILQREGNGFVAKHGADFMKSKDKWFRGLDLSTGPDGSVFVIDWSDAGECHDSDGVHRTSGRIYKIVYGKDEPARTFDLSKMDDTALAKEAAAHPGNNWWPRMIARVRADRGAQPLEPKLPQLADANSSDSLVRLHTASAMQRLPLDARFPFAIALAAHAEDANDRQQPLMIWYGIEPAIAAHPDQAIALAMSSKIPTVRRLVTRRLTEEIERTPDPVDALLAAALKSGNADTREDIVRGMGGALKGFRQVAKPAHWDDFVKALGAQQPDIVRNVSLVFGSGRAVEEIIALIKDGHADANARLSAFDSLMRNAKPEHFAIARSMISDKVLGTAARLGLAKFSEGDVPKSLLTNWPDRSQEWRAANVTTLASRAAWAKELLTFAEKNPTVRGDITPIHARQIRSLGDEAVNKQLTKVWGELHDTPEAKKQEIAKWRSLLTAAALAQGDASKGRALFTTVCAACHKMYGDGAAIAPELTGSDRRNLDYLLENIVDPSAVVPADYRIAIVKLKDGRTLSGVIPEQNDRTVTVQTPAERVSFLRSDIAEMQQLSQSFMPEGLLTALGEENVKHLIAYLMSSGQVPLPK
ncbi:MAG: c-type cytochrome [Verrucomicrobia bacterium]|nr:c-type cytochrome [Verrucomicrobiota bacterium]